MGFNIFKALGLKRLESQARNELKKHGIDAGAILAKSGEAFLRSTLMSKGLPGNVIEKIVEGAKAAAKVEG